MAHPDGANASCEDKGDRPETCDTLAGLRAGGTKRIAPRPREMTNEPRGHVFCEAAPSRADKPHGGNDCSRAYHGPGHEIVKKPFAPPSGGDQTSRPARGGATESNCPKFCWLDLTAAFAANIAPQNSAAISLHIGRRRLAQAPARLFTEKFMGKDPATDGFQIS